MDTLTIAWATIYGYVCAYYCALYVRRRAEREYLIFGLLAGALCVYAAGHAALLRATSFEEGHLAMKITGVGLITLLPLFVDFCYSWTHRRSPITTFIYLWSAAGLVALLAGWMFDPSQPTAVANLEMLGTRPIYAVRIRTFGFGWWFLGALIAGLGTFRLLSVMGQTVEARWIFVAAVTNVAAGMHDVLFRLGLFESVYLLEHTAMLTIFVVSYILLDRFVRTRRELRDHTAELSHNYAELESSQQELVQKEQLAAVGELSAVIAHEIRNPLAIIKNAVSGFRRPTLRDQDRATLLDILSEETDRLNRIMHDLLAYARPVTPDMRATNLRELLQQAVAETAEQTAHTDQVDITWKLEGAPETIHVDPTLLQNAIRNVLKNAMQAMPDGGELTISAQPIPLDNDDGVRLTFRDTGEGMEEQVRLKAHAPFFTTRSKGTGLGLAIVERVAKNHGGQVSILSELGVGTSVRLDVLIHPPPLFSTPPIDGEDLLFTTLEHSR